MNLGNMPWLDNSIFLFFGLSLVSNFLIAYLWHVKFYTKIGLKAYKAIQRIHLNETPRLGGAIFLISLLGFAYFSENNEIVELYKLLLLSLTPIIFVAIKEDLFHNVAPSTRLIALLAVGVLFKILYKGTMPDLNHLAFLQENFFLHWESIFFVLAIVAIANGMNLIDGVNGLCGIVSLSMLLSICFLSYKLGDIVILSAAFNLIILVIPFMIINYPYGKIFLGDLGAYSLGLICSILTIILFGRHPEISPWTAVLIVIYPLIEVIFSILRRLSEGASIYSPDTSHLHLRIYYFFKSFPPFAKIANSIVMPMLSFIWLFPLITIPWVYKIPTFILFAMLIFLVTYLAMYYAASAQK